MYGIVIIETGLKCEISNHLTF